MTNTKTKLIAYAEENKRETDRVLNIGA